MSLSKQQQQEVGQGTIRTPKYYEGATCLEGDVCIRFRYFTYGTGAGLVSGIEANVMFTIDRPAKDVWPYFKDFNLWMNANGYRWSDVAGNLYSREARDLGDQALYLSVDNPEKPSQKHAHEYIVLRVIPERMIVVFEPIPEDGTTGGVSPGFHVDMLSEVDGKTVLTLLMEHASRSLDKTEEEALSIWRGQTPGYMRTWREEFIPTLRQLVHEGR